MKDQLGLNGQKKEKGMSEDEKNEKNMVKVQKQILSPDFSMKRVQGLQMTNFDGKRALLAGRDDKMDLNLQLGV